MKAQFKLLIARWDGVITEEDVHNKVILAYDLGNTMGSKQHPLT